MTCLVPDIKQIEKMSISKPKGKNTDKMPNAIPEVKIVP